VLASACSSSQEAPAASGGAGSGSGGSAGGFAGNAAHGGSSGAASGTGGASASAGSASSAGSESAAGTGGATAGAAGSDGAGGASSQDFCAARLGLLACETFEAAAPGPAQASGAWAPSVNGEGTLVVDEAVAHAGSKSLRVTGSGFSTFWVWTADAAAAAPSPLYVRAFVRLAEAMTSGHNTFIIADLASAPGTGNAFRLGEMNAMLMYTVSGDTHGALSNDDYYTDHVPGAALAANQWGCLEVKLDHDSPEVAVSLDGVAIPDLHHTDWPLDAFDAVRFGFEKYAGPVSDVWYDDLAIATAPIGCQ
jgi:hypothetical protein